MKSPGALPEPASELAGSTNLCYGLSNWLYVTAALGLLIDAMSPVMNAHSQSIWQTQTPRELQGRVLSVRTTVAWAMIPAGNALGGWAASRFNPGLVLAALGALIAVYCSLQLLNPQLLRVEDKAWLGGMAAPKLEA